MFGKTILGAALIAVMATASAEVTVNHAFISFETVAAAQKNVKADEYVQLTGHLVKTTDAEVYELTKQEMNIPSQLLEHVAGRICRALRHHFPQIEQIEIRVSKLNPPFGGDVHSASVLLID